MMADDGETENPDEQIENFESDEDETLTAQIVLQKIECAWLNEKFAPEILPHQSELVECMTQQIEHIEENIKRIDKSDLRYSMHTLELSRIKYMVSSYLRTRVEKIERYVYHILEQEEHRDASEEPYLTAEEFQFARDYANGLETLFNTLALRHLPETFRKSKFVTRPNLDAHVFLKVKKTVNGILIRGIQDDEEIDLDVGSQHIVQYKAIAHLVKNGSVQLI